MQRSILGLLLILCLALLLPAAALAGGADEGTEGAPCSLTEGCSRTEGCTLPDGHEGECVVESPQQPCSRTEGCTLPAGHEGECVVESPQQSCSLTEGCPLPDGHEGECVTAPANEEENPLPDGESFPTNGPMLLSSGSGTEDDPWLVESAKDLTDAFEKGGYIQLKEDITVDDRQAWSVGNGKDVVLDLNGHDITSNYGEINNYIIVIDGGALTIDDSSAQQKGMLQVTDSSYGYGIQLRGKGSSFTLLGGTIKTTQETLDIYTPATNSSINIKGGQLISTDDSVLGVRGEDTKVEITDGELSSSGRTGVYISNYGEPESIQFEMTGGELIFDGGSSGAIQLYNGATVTIGGTAKIKSSTSYAIQVQENTILNVTGGEIATTAGMSPAISCEDESTVNISDGKISSQNRAAIEVGFSYTGENQSTVNISGGEITTESNRYSAIKVDENIAAQVNITSGKFDNENLISGPSKNIHITGGQFAQNVSGYLPAGNTQDKDGNVVASDDAVASINGFGYTDLATAMQAAKDNETVKLEKDFTVDQADPIAIREKKVTLDLNGHTVTSIHNASNYFLFTVSDAELTIDDSSETKNGMIDTSSAQQTGGVKVYNNGTFTLAGGSFQTKGVALDVPNNNTNVTINISGGSLTSTYDNVMRINGKGTKIHVSDGYVGVDSPGSGIFLSGSSDNAADRIQFEISGGEVAVKDGIRAVKNVSLTLSGNGKVIAGTTIKLEENSSLLVSGGTSVGNLDANNTCDISMRGGKVEGSVILKDQSTFTLSAGEIIDDTWHAIETRGQNSVTINGGSIETKSTQRAAVAINADSTATITGGFFTGKQTVTGTVGNVVISGGKFSGDVSQYIAAQHSGLVTQDADYPFWVGDYNDETAQQALENKGVARLQVNQANVYYTSLQEAVAAAGENAVITLIADTDEAFAIGKPLIIMRNGFTASQISADAGYQLVTTEGSYLIIPAPAEGTTYTVKYYLENVEQTGDAQSVLTAEELSAALGKTYADHYLLRIEGPGTDKTYCVYYARNVYQVTVQIYGRGTAEATPNSAISGSKIQLSATAQPGYRFAGWRVLAGDVTIAADGSFTMPQQNVTVLATFTLRSGSSSSSSRDYYQLRFDVNGGNAISALRRVENTTIDLNNYTPVREGYRFTGWYADAALSERITSIRLTEDTTVYAGWQKITQLPFLDIDETDSYYDAVCYVYENGLIIGTSDTLYSPDMSITRGMIATILWRVEGKPAAGANPFPDVAAGSYYESAIAWAAANGVINGYEDGNYRPNEAISREELAAILYRYALNKGYASAAAEHAALTQADAGTVLDWAVPAMQWACETGVLSARADGLLQPGAEASRAEAAVAFYVLAGTLAAQ